MSGKKSMSGTREWASKSDNCVTGCEHGCLYCYARHNAVDRFRRVKSHEAWTHPVVRQKEVSRRRHKCEGTVMFPTTHDITPAVLDPCMKVIMAHLKVGNDLLIVSKPHPECIDRITSEAEAYKEQILFRFTIGSPYDAVLSLWEPGAPCFTDRLHSLQLAHSQGFRTSVSCEPLLSPDAVMLLYRELKSWVTDSIWIGTLNRPSQRVGKNISRELRKSLDLITSYQTPEEMRKIGAMLEDLPLIKWKESYKKVLGIPLITEPGQDE